MEQTGRDPITHARLIVLNCMATDVRDSNTIVPPAPARPRRYHDEPAAFGPRLGIWNFGIVALGALISLAYMTWFILSQ